MKPNALLFAWLAVSLMLLPSVTRAELIYDRQLKRMVPDPDGVTVQVKPAHTAATGRARASRSTTPIARVPGDDFEEAVISCVSERIRSRVEERENLRSQIKQEEDSHEYDQNQDEQDDQSQASQDD